MYQSLKGKVLRWSKIRTSKGNVGFVYQSLKGKVLRGDSYKVSGSYGCVNLYQSLKGKVLPKEDLVHEGEQISVSIPQR